MKGVASSIYESGMKDRVVVTEFDSLEKAVGAHDSQAYKETLKMLDDAAVRDVRIVEGFE
jgi:uncharacterized protein (DUF1330 family)